MVYQVSKAAVALILWCLIQPDTAGARTQNYSFHSDEPEHYLAAIEQPGHASSRTCPDTADDYRAGIVTHHLLAIGLMNDFFSCLARKARPERIILIGPDHYGQSREQIAISRLPWKTPFGVLKAGAATAQRMQESLGVREESEAFSGEHSIGALVPFIRYYFPESVVVPIIIQRNVETQKLIRMKLLLDELLNDPGTIVLLSMDFSHDHSPEEADRRDRLARSVIERLDYQGTDQTDVDCHPGLKVLLASLKGRKRIGVTVLDHSNSGRISGEKGAVSVTSYFTILFSEAKEH